MALFRIGPPADTANFIRGEGLYLRPPEMRDFDEWAALRAESRQFLSPWEPTWPADDLTRPAFRRRLRRHAEEVERDEAFPFFIFREGDNALIGGLTIGQIRRGVAQTGTFGYWMGARFARNGYMTRAVRAACGFAFAILRLHRIEAACLPHNIPSMRLLEANGFKREGLARSYLRINGAWQDHVLFALIETDIPPARPPA